MLGGMNNEQYNGIFRLDGGNVFHPSFHPSQPEGGSVITDRKAEEASAKATKEGRKEWGKWQ